MSSPGYDVAVGAARGGPAWRRSADRAAKRGLDLLLSLVGVVIAAPVMLIIAALIKITSPGPVLYRGVRAGRNGIPFRILKYRTMVVDAEQRGGPTTGTDDPRVTRIGRVLRRTKLDELPQLFNVLIGDMSFVGPRPEVLLYTEQYSQEEQIILSVRPGITDLASIEFADLDDRVGHDDPDAFFRTHILPRKNELRVRYVREWTLLRDFSILGQTFLRVLQRGMGR